MSPVPRKCGLVLPTWNREGGREGREGGGKWEWEGETGGWEIWIELNSARGNTKRGIGTGDDRTRGRYRQRQKDTKRERIIQTGKNAGEEREKGR